MRPSNLFAPSMGWSPHCTVVGSGRNSRGASIISTLCCQQSQNKHKKPAVASPVALLHPFSWMKRYQSKAIQTGEITMQKTMPVAASRIWDICIILLLLLQGIVGLVISVSQLVQLLAPGRPVIVTGMNIFTGPIAGIAFVVALASLVVIWGWWTRQPWARHRIVLIECISLAIGIVEFIEPHLSHSVPIARIAIAVLVLLCLYITGSHHMHSPHLHPSSSKNREIKRRDTLWKP